MPTFPSFSCMPMRWVFMIATIMAALSVVSCFVYEHYRRTDSNIVGDVYVSGEVFGSNYAEMKGNLKIYVYPNVFGYDNGVSVKTMGYYAVEDHFMKNLRECSFLTAQPKKAHLFFIPLSFHRMRNKIWSNEEITSISGKYLEGLIMEYPYWNTTLGLNHFLLTCYGKDMEATRVVQNSIRLVCSSNYSAGFIPRKDVTIPSAMQPFSKPSRGKAMEKRTTLAYWAGVGNSDTRKALVELWSADKELDFKSQVNLSSRIEKLQSAKFCICPVGSVNSNSRITMVILNGCVPVIMEDHIDLPFNDVLDWQKFSVILNEGDAHLLKDILKSKAAGADYKMLYSNVIKVQLHFYFQWDTPPVEYDAFHMIMYELWLRRSTIRS